MRTKTSAASWLGSWYLGSEGCSSLSIRETREFIFWLFSVKIIISKSFNPFRYMDGSALANLKVENDHPYVER
jgi:hypothetical protein